MNIKKVLFVVLLFGLMRLSHAADMPILHTTNFELPPSNSNQVSVYPCLGYPCFPNAHTNTNCLNYALQ